MLGKLWETFFRIFSVCDVSYHSAEREKVTTSVFSDSLKPLTDLFVESVCFFSALKNTTLKQMQMHKESASRIY